MTGLDAVRAVADAVLYEGYLLYPYRASARKNRSRWQFGVLGPPGAAERGLGEESGMAVQCLLTRAGTVDVHLRFLQLQVREVQRRDHGGGYEAVGALDVAGRTVLSWDEAVEREATFSGLTVDDADELRVEISGGEDVEPLREGDGAPVGRIVRRRWPLSARVRVTAEPDDGFVRLTVAVDNAHPTTAATPEGAIRTSLIGAHLVITAHDAAFVSVIDPPAAARDAAGRCRQHRCWPVLAGPPGSTDVVLGAPIILYDHPEIADESPGALFDATEIDEILILRVMTMTEAEKAEARATDPRAAAIIDRCDTMSPADLARLHGILRDPPDAVEPGAVDSVVVDGVRVSRGSLVRVLPTRRADAQDLFFAGQVARVTNVVSDLDGNTHVAVVLVDDPAADLHDEAGRYLYFAPDEIQPLHEEESVS